MQEICQSGSEGGAKRTFVPTLSLPFSLHYWLTRRSLSLGRVSPYPPVAVARACIALPAARYCSGVCRPTSV